MAQLSDDCFAFGGPMLSVDEAVAMITARVTAIAETETVALRDADGRILANDIVAPLPLPPFTNSAVDGYAVRSADLPTDAERALLVAERVQAGASARLPVAPGQAVRIFTGAPMPDGADTVFMQEDVRLDDAGRVVVPSGLHPGANVRPAGEDIAIGQVALRKGCRLRPQDVALVAALGVGQVEVRRRICVGVASTGDEVVTPGQRRDNAQLYDSNRFMLIAMLSRLGCDVRDLGILPDERAEVAKGLRQAADRCDLIVTSGGVSTGEADHVKDGIESAGSLVLWRMAIKPGRPVAMGIVAGTPLIGLPGNPVASFVTFVHVVRPTVLALAGGVQQHRIALPVRAGFNYRKKAGRREYVRVHLKRNDDGSVEAIKFPREGAGLLSSLVETDGLVELAESLTTVTPGQMVEFIAYESFL
jgi:molybdopterin molybdotransferase